VWTQVPDIMEFSSATMDAALAGLPGRRQS
jgi:hypothetical protein